MTPERRKYFEHISEREKALRDEIDNKKRTLKNLKFRLSHSVNQTANETYKEHIKYHKYILCALKHELERIQPTTDVEYINYPDSVIDYEGGIINYECCSCHEGFTVYLGDTPPSHCPHCHRKIKRDC